MSNKKDDDVITVEDESSFNFNDESSTEISVQKPGPLEKRDRRSKKQDGTEQQSSRAVSSTDAEFFDIE